MEQNCKAADEPLSQHHFNHNTCTRTKQNSRTINNTTLIRINNIKRRVIMKCSSVPSLQENDRYEADVESANDANPETADEQAEVHSEIARNIQANSEGISQDSELRFTIRDLDTGQVIHALNNQDTLEDLLASLTVPDSFVCDNQQRRHSAPSSQTLASRIYAHVRNLRRRSINSGTVYNTKQLNGIAKLRSPSRKRWTALWQQLSQNESYDRAKTRVRSTSQFAKRKLRAGSSQFYRNRRKSSNSHKGHQAVNKGLEQEEQVNNVSDFGETQVKVNHHNGSIWVTSFSPDGKFVATAGDDGRISVWQIAPDVIFNDEPIQTFVGHTAEVLSLSWSKGSDFVVSGGNDGMARVWHISKPNALRVFEHVQCVTQVCFHPNYTNRFVSSSLDCKLRVWDIPHGSVEGWVATPAPATSVCFNGDGTLIAAGLSDGQYVLYQTANLSYYSQGLCKNSRGQHSLGRAVTGIQFFSRPTQPQVDMESSSQTNLKGSTKELILVTTNDSRIRICDVEHSRVVFKLKGLVNSKLPLVATIDSSQSRVACGSQDGALYVWQLPWEDLEVNESKSLKSQSLFAPASSTAKPLTTIFSKKRRSLTRRRGSATRHGFHGTGANPGSLFRTIKCQHFTMIQVQVQQDGIEPELQAPLPVTSCCFVPLDSLRTSKLDAFPSAIVCGDATGTLKVFAECASEV